MCRKFTPEELNTMDIRQKDDVIFQMQDRLDKLEQDYERLVEQIRIANAQKFGRSREKLNDLVGQLSFFNEAEACCDENAAEPAIDDVIDESLRKPRKPKQKGQREEDLKDFPQECHTHDVSKEKLDSTFGEGSWKSMPDETYWQLRFEPARWIAEKHVIKVYVGTGGLHLSKQTISNWTVWSAERYFEPLYKFMKARQLQAHVNQCDETTVEVIHDGRPAGSKSYMWVHLTGELGPEPVIVVYEYQKTRHSDHPKEYYRDFEGVLVTDGLSQYHKIARELEGLENANCWAHARRDFADALKAIGKGNQKAIKSSIAYKALLRIGTIYDLENALKDLSPAERLKERQASIRPLVEEYFAWVKETLNGNTLLPKGKTAEGLQYSINQEEYLRVFLTDGEIPIDNSASERALRNFTIGRKNWMTINTIRGAEASAVIYSITETARANKLNVYYYISHLLTELPKLLDKNGNIEQSQLEQLAPWSKNLPVDCYSRRRS